MRHVRTVVIVAVSVALFIVVAANDNVTCIPAPPEEPVCMAPADCEGLPHILCVGEWTCAEGLCVWDCEPEPPPPPPESECFADDECPSAHECVLEEWCPPCVYENPGCEMPCYAIGQCLPLESECMADDDCPPGQVCILESYCPPCVDSDPPCMAPCWAVGQCVEPPSECKVIDPWAYGMCEMLMGAGWDGEKCAYVSGCGCDDCAGIFNSMEECLDACVGPMPD